MEKISGILPPSARTRVADVAVAQPARPGAPALGRPMGKNSLGDRVTLSKQLEEMRQTGELPQFEEPVTYKNTTEGRKAKVIEDLQQKFFSPKNVARDDDMTKSEEALKKTATNESLFYVEKELRPPEKPLVETNAPPLKETQT